MILQRITVRYKFGKADEALVLLKAEGTRAVKKGLWLKGVRFLKPWSEDDLTVGEFVWESHAQAVEMWDKWGKDPGTKAFWDAYSALMERGSSTEYFTIA